MANKHHTAYLKMSGEPVTAIANLVGWVDVRKPNNQSKVIL
ncbi:MULTISPECIES: hypothetical protein [unclassified Microcystis]|nr:MULTISPECIES: hypothetical protein [unclassified Microcystis]MCU7245535.1 hypothetical protein [Microcystis aeruginosa WS75]